LLPLAIILLPPHTIVQAIHDEMAAGDNGSIMDDHPSELEGSASVIGIDEPVGVWCECLGHLYTVINPVGVNAMRVPRNIDEEHVRKGMREAIL
jgi:hypothetical protein